MSEISTPQPQRGALIVVEGLDRSGKSSQCEILYRNLSAKGYNVRSIRFPDRSMPTGKLIDSYLRGASQLDDHAIHLLFSANRWEVAKSIEDDIHRGVTVIIDRYSYSGAVYSAAKNNPNLSLQWAWLPEVGLPRPDVCLFLSISIEEAAQRGDFGVERYETKAMQQRVRQLFQSLIVLPHNNEFEVIDAGKSLEEVAEDMLQGALRTIGTLPEIGSLRRFHLDNFIPADISY